jgi:hypothetical protein
VFYSLLEQTKRHISVNNAEMSDEMVEQSCTITAVWSRICQTRLMDTKEVTSKLKAVKRFPF